MTTPFKFEVGQKFRINNLDCTGIVDGSYSVGDTFEIATVSAHGGDDHRGFHIGLRWVEAGMFTLIEENKIMTEEKWRELLQGYGMRQDIDGDWYYGKQPKIAVPFGVHPARSIPQLKGLALAALYEVWKQEQQQKLDEIPF